MEVPAGFGIDVGILFRFVCAGRRKGGLDEEDGVLGFTKRNLIFQTAVSRRWKTGS